MIYSWNNTIACSPFATTEVTTDKASKYFAAVESNNALEELTVYYGTDQIPAGSKVYVLASLKKAAWATPNNTITFEGKKIVLVPLADIKLVQKGLTPTTTPEWSRSGSYKGEF